MNDDCKFEVTLDHQILEEVCILSDDYPNLYNIFTQESRFVLDISEEDLVNLIDDTESDLSRIIVGFDIDYQRWGGAVEYFKTNPEEMLNHPRSLYVLDVDDGTAMNLSEKYGMLVLSRDNLDDNVFNKGVFRLRIDKENIVNDAVTNAWGHVLNGLEMLPSNSMVISDSYLFHAHNITLDDSVKNIQSILDKLLPIDMECEYHVLFCTEDPNKTSQEINKAVGDIKSFIRARRRYNVVIEYVICSNCQHQRTIISNYNVITFDKGIITFKGIGKKGIPCKAIDTNKVYCSTIFQNAYDSHGMSEFQIATKDLKDTKKWYKNCQELCNSDCHDSSRRILGTNNHNKELNNRIIKYL